MRTGPNRLHLMSAHHRGARPRPEVKVSFILDDDGLDGDVSVVGDFNDWDPMATPLRKRKGKRVASVTAMAGR